MSVAEGLSLACSGFLLAVLWMDLIFDSQVRVVRGGELPEQVLASIADYYRRATTTSRPMSRLIAAMMVILSRRVGVSSVRGDDPVSAHRRVVPFSPPYPSCSRGPNRAQRRPTRWPIRRPRRTVTARPVGLPRPHRVPAGDIGPSGGVAGLVSSAAGNPPAGSGNTFE